MNHLVIKLLEGIESGACVFKSLVSSFRFLQEVSKTVLSSLCIVELFVDSKVVDFLIRCFVYPGSNEFQLPLEE